MINFSPCKWITGCLGVSMIIATSIVKEVSANSVPVCDNEKGWTTEGNTCVCDTRMGFIEENNQCVCDSLKGWLTIGNTCVCNNEKGWTTEGNTCACHHGRISDGNGTCVVDCGNGLDWNKISNKCVCSQGFKQGNTCVEKCSTSEGFILTQEENTCVCDSSKGFTQKWNTCVCDSSKGFIRNGNTCDPVCDYDNGFIQAGNTCVCDYDNGFIQAGNTCVCDRDRGFKTNGNTCDPGSLYEYLNETKSESQCDEDCCGGAFFDEDCKLTNLSYISNEVIIDLMYDDDACNLCPDLNQPLVGASRPCVNAFIEGMHATFRDRDCKINKNIYQNSGCSCQKKNYDNNPLMGSDAESESTSDASKQGAVLALSILTTAGLAVLV